jgi:hypothetical protein
VFERVRRVAAILASDAAEERRLSKALSAIVDGAYPELKGTRLAARGRRKIQSSVKRR